MGHLIVTFFEFCLEGLVAGLMARNEFPELRGMIEVDGVAEFVDEDVAHNGWA